MMEVRNTPVYGSMLSSNPLVGGAQGFVSVPGRYKGQKAAISIDESILSKHLLLIGGTGCGKSNVFYHLIAQIQRRMTTKDVMIIFDTKGDFYQTFGKEDDYIIGNSSAYSDKSCKWNIFREVLSDGWDRKKLELNIQEMSWAIYRESIERSKDPFFPNAARDLFAAVLFCILMAGENDSEYKKENFYNSELKRAFEESSIHDIRELLLTQPSVASITSYIGDGQNTQALGVYAELLSTFRRLFVGVFAERGAFSMRNFVREKGGRTLFIEYDLSIGNVLAPVYSLLFDLALKEALGRSHPDGNVYLICDEFRLIPYLQHIDDGVNFGRSLGVKVIAGLQSISQLTEVYKEERGKNIAAGFSTVFGFRANDRVTREHITGLYGKNVIQEEYKTLTNSIKEERRNANVVEDWDMNGLAVGEAVVGFPFLAPFRFQFDLYAKEGR